MQAGLSKLFSPHVWMKLQVGSDCSNLRERLRQGLFAFTPSCFGQPGLFLMEGWEKHWAAGTRCASWAGVCAVCFCSKYLGRLWRSQTIVQVHGPGEA